MANPTTARTGKGMTLALQILAGIDLVLSLMEVSLCLQGGWPFMARGVSEDMLTVGIVAMMIMAQIPMRIAALIVISRWTFRLVANAHRQARFGVSPRWAWLGWFVPFAAYVVPASAVMKLNLESGRLTGSRRLLILAWWLARLGSCVSGSLLILVGLALYAVAVDGISSMAEHNVTIVYLGWLALTGLAAKALELAVVTITWRHQPKLGQVLAATVF